MARCSLIPVGPGMFRDVVGRGTNQGTALSDGSSRFDHQYGRERKGVSLIIAETSTMAWPVSCGILQYSRAWLTFVDVNCVREGEQSKLLNKSR